MLFCDLVGSTKLAASLDPEDWHEVLRRYQQTCTEVVALFEGHVAQYLGDGLLVYFGFPMAHEDDAERSVRAGLRIVATLERLDLRLERQHRFRLQVRIGVHTGLVVVGNVGSGQTREALALGNTPNVAARLQQLATPGTVVISAATLRLVRGVFITHELGERDLKGLPEPVQVYEVHRPSGVRSRLDAQARLTPLVGRQKELQLLLDRWQQAADGRGQTVLLEGEAGIGKSRLMRAFQEQLGQVPHTWLEAHGSPHSQDSPLLPVLELSRRLLAFNTADSAEKKIEKIEKSVAAAELPLPYIVPFLIGFHSLPLPPSYSKPNLSPEGLRKRTLEVLADWVLMLARHQPLVVLVEDLHWIDPSTKALLSLILARLADEQVLVVATYRPELTPPWNTDPHVTTIALQRLQAHEANKLAHSCADRELPTTVIAEIARRTDGIPLYVEELTKSLIRWDSTKHEPELLSTRQLLPSTLRDSLMARLDQLGEAKPLAQVAACLGREFTYELLAAVSLLDKRRQQQLLRIAVAAEIFYHRGTLAYGTYFFKHALIQEAAYRSLLRAKRAQYHQRIAEILEQRFPDAVESQPEVLARHFAAAGEVERAIDYWHRAGQRAMERSAAVEAESHLSQALTALESLPAGSDLREREIGLRALRAKAAAATEGWGSDRVEEDLARAHVICQDLGDLPQVPPILLGLFFFYFMRADRRQVRQLASEVWLLANKSQGPEHLIMAHQARAHWAFASARHAEAIVDNEELLKLYEPHLATQLVSALSTHPAPNALSYKAQSLWYLGYPDRALDQSLDAVAAAEEIDHSLTLAQVLQFHAALRFSRREYEECKAVTKRLMALAAEQDFRLFQASGLIFQGLVESIPDEDMVCQGLAIFRATGSRFALPYFLLQLGEAVLHAGRIGAGLSYIDEAKALIASSLNDFSAPEVKRIDGELLLQRDGPTPEVESCFEQAIASARQQSARSLELRAAMSLTRLRQRQGRNAEAHRLLAPIYDTFTEGFDTGDLKDARDLLEQLA